MAKTTSWSFPNLIDPVRNKVSIAEDATSVTNRVRLLILTEPTELYNEPTFGVGLKKYLWQYNTDNVRAIIQNKIIDQLNLYEPCVDAESTEFAKGLKFTGDENVAQQFNELQMTVGLRTIYGDEVNIELNTDKLTSNQ